MSARAVLNARRKVEKLHKEMEDALNHLAQYPEASVNVTTACYRKILLEKDGWIMSRGIAYDVRGKSLGARVYKIKLVVRDMGWKKDE